MISLNEILKMSVKNHFDFKNYNSVNSKILTFDPNSADLTMLKYKSKI